MTARAEAQVLRLALTYALLDRADAIWTQHLEAALAFHQYAVDSAHFIVHFEGDKVVKVEMLDEIGPSQRVADGNAAKD